MLNSILSDISRNKTSKKLLNIIKNYNLDNSVINELYNNNQLNKNINKKLSILNPFELTKRVEYLNIGTTTIATMLNTEVSNGINLWDAYDEEGNLKTELFDNSIINDWSYNPNSINSLIDLNLKLHK